MSRWWPIFLKMSSALLHEINSSVSELRPILTRFAVWWMMSETPIRRGCRCLIGGRRCWRALVLGPMLATIFVRILGWRFQWVKSADSTCIWDARHVELPLVSAGTKGLLPGPSEKGSKIALFTIITGEHGVTIRIFRGGMKFMNAPASNFNAAVEDAKFL